MNTVLITGASRGIGLGLVSEYVAAGWRVIACCRESNNALSLNEIKNKASNRLSIYKLDVTNENDIINLANRLASDYIDILINNAGVLDDKDKDGQLIDLQCLNASIMINSFKVNSIAPLMLTKYLLPTILGGNLKKVVNLSSLWGSISQNNEGGIYAYRASKAALNAITKSLSIDLKSSGITVIAMSPGWVRTDMGGHQADITIEESASCIRTLIDRLTFNDSGRSLSNAGETIPW